MLVPLLNSLLVAATRGRPLRKKFYEIGSRILKAMLGHMAKHGYPDTFPEDGSIFNSSTPRSCTYLPFTPEEEKVISNNSFWMEGVFQTTIGLLGILGNVTAIVIYWTSGSKFYTIFYRYRQHLLLGLDSQ